MVALDANASLELFSQTSSTALMLSDSFVKQAGDKIVRVLITGFSGIGVALGRDFTINVEGIIRFYRKIISGTGQATEASALTRFQDTFDISQFSDGTTIDVTVTCSSIVDATTKGFKNAF